MNPAKIQSTHLARRAYVYVRQSTPLQVLQHQESTERQYRLQQRALDLGWPPTAVETNVLPFAIASINDSGVPSLSEVSATMSNPA